MITSKTPKSHMKAKEKVDKLHVKHKKPEKWQTFVENHGGKKGRTAGNVGQPHKEKRFW